MAYFRWFNLNNPLVSHNLFVSKGIYGSVDHPDIQNLFFMGSSGENKKREQIFEEIRLKEFSVLPSRRSAVWLFDDYALAQKCGKEWGYIGQGRDLIEVEIFIRIKMLKADSNWINCVSSEYENNARKYWSGGMSENPVPEILFEGVLKLLGDSWKGKCKLMTPDQFRPL